MSNIDNNNKKITKIKLSKKFVKGIDDDLILPTINWDDFLENNWCYIYPNGGTAENPANVIVNSRYILENPFPEYIVDCIAEILYNGNWGTARFIYEGGGYGVEADMENDHIVVTTGSSCLNASGLGCNGGSLLFSTNLNSAPCRIKVYKIGKVKKNG